MTPEQINIERMLDNAATASQCRGLLRDDYDNETPLREAVRRNVVDPLLSELSKLRAVAFTHDDLTLLDRALATLGSDVPPYDREGPEADAVHALREKLHALAAREEQG